MNRGKYNQEFRSSTEQWKSGESVSSNDLERQAVSGVPSGRLGSPSKEDRIKEETEVPSFRLMDPGQKMSGTNSKSQSPRADQGLKVKVELNVED